MKIEFTHLCTLTPSWPHNLREYYIVEIIFVDSRTKPTRGIYKHLPSLFGEPKALCQIIVQLLLEEDQNVLSSHAKVKDMQIKPSWII